MIGQSQSFTHRPLWHQNGLVLIAFVCDCGCTPGKRRTFKLILSCPVLPFVSHKEDQQRQSWCEWILANSLEVNSHFVNCAIMASAECHDNRSQKKKSRCVSFLYKSNPRRRVSIENVKETKTHILQVSKESRKVPTCFTTALVLKRLYRR